MQKHCTATRRNPTDPLLGAESLGSTSMCLWSVEEEVSWICD